MKTFKVTRISLKGKSDLGIERGQSVDEVVERLSRKTPMTIFKRNGHETVAEKTNGHAHFFFEEITSSFASELNPNLKASLPPV